MLYLWLQAGIHDVFHDLKLKARLFLQQKWESDVDVDEGNVSYLCPRSVNANKFFDKSLVAAHRDEPGQHYGSSFAQIQQVQPGKPVELFKLEPKDKVRRTVKTVRVDDRVAKFGTKIWLVQWEQCFEVAMLR